MGAKTNTAKAVPNDPAAKVSRRCRSDHRWFAPALAVLKRIYTRKFPENVGSVANRHPRVCETWKSGRGAPDGEALVALLNGEHGDQLFLALTKSSPFAWRKRIARQIRIEQLLDQQKQHAAELDALRRGES